MSIKTHISVIFGQQKRNLSASLGEIQITIKSTSKSFKFKFWKTHNSGFHQICNKTGKSKYPVKNVFLLFKNLIHIY